MDSKVVQPLSLVVEALWNEYKQVDNIFVDSQRISNSVKNFLLRTFFKPIIIFKAEFFVPQVEDLGLSSSFVVQASIDDLFGDILLEQATAIKWSDNSVCF